ncbi:PPR domain-containing protein/PPR_2 domain-containing protein/PPR_3 domain-containing protein [Cephalotus follicularis]|uniref:PPR domain-containing protein/PPR_2 domain-containing protein/PPR_3 domain-containing protein n=1 Tax=Cephalotus follicularis TaxID=3775 RepID=A0A1Q3AVK1_CEPFO|nr:PPR domain-containing protein/PPR_2 domain-containing protein/PPR_3 domain-containing protein [Cephalotus follicularis]
MNIPLSLSLQKPPLLYPNTQVDSEHPIRDYNSVIKHYVKLKNDHAILSTYTHMESLNVAPDKAVLPLIIKACARLNAIERGKRIHLGIMGTDLIRDVKVGTALVGFYCKCGFIGEARNVFEEMDEKDLVLWNAMINGYVGCGEYGEGVLLFMEMQKEGLRPNSRTLVALLLACEECLELRFGKEIHAYGLRNGLFDLDPHVGTALIGFYSSFDMRIAYHVFDLIVVRNIVSWNAMITGYFNAGDSLAALNIFVRMLLDKVEIDSVTLLVVIQASAMFGCHKLGLQLHQIVIKFNYCDDMFIVNALLNMYIEVGSLELACELFDANPTCDVALWNSMLFAYVTYEWHEEAVSLLVRMRTEGLREDERTIVIMLSLCAKLAHRLKKGKSVHAHAVKSGMRLRRDVSLGNALLSLYEELSCFESVKKVFDEMSNVDIISYNIFILALARNNMRSEACELFEVVRESAVKPNSYTIISILSAFEDESCLKIGRSVHGFVIKQGIEINVPLNTALTDMYMNCSDEATAMKLFESCPHRDPISWNALIASYIKSNQANKALLLFNRMILESEPNAVTIINILSTCTHLANLPQGQYLHAYITRREFSFGFNLSLANAFITMYGRCGSIKYAENIFEFLPRKNTISWNAMITGYGMLGRGDDAVSTFLQMLKDGFQPNGITFVSLLSACSHSVLIEKGLQIFHSMVQNFSITPELAHYGCVVDLLGRGGYLGEAKEFIKSMPIKPDASVWRALLSAYRVHSESKEVETIFEKLVELEPMNAGNYVLLSNTYAAAGLWSDVRRIRTWLSEKGLRKPPGISWIVIKTQIHCFTASDRSHPQSDKIYATLSSMLLSLKQSGYTPDFYQALHDKED